MMTLDELRRLRLDVREEIRQLEAAERVLIILMQRRADGGSPIPHLPEIEPVPQPLTAATVHEFFGRSGYIDMEPAEAKKPIPNGLVELPSQSEPVEANGHAKRRTSKYCLPIAKLIKEKGPLCTKELQEILGTYPPNFSSALKNPKWFTRKLVGQVYLYSATPFALAQVAAADPEPDDTDLEPAGKAEARDNRATVDLTPDVARQLQLLGKATHIELRQRLQANHGLTWKEADNLISKAQDKGIITEKIIEGTRCYILPAATAAS